MDSTSSTGLLNLLTLVAGAAPALLALVLAFFAVAGVIMVGTAVKGFYDLTAYGNYGHGGYQHRTHGGLMWRLFIGSVLTSLPVAIGVLGNSVFGTEVATGLMAYQTGGMSAVQRAALDGIFKVFAIMGVMSFGHGWVVLNAHKSGTSNVSPRTPLVWIGAGLGLIYLPQVLKVISWATGIDVLNLLLF
ncbi:hypothetical protein LA345_37090 (plasmid) [Burkholderia vietnamiensis]|uniref:Uncharacterized protein n=1 Tax=Burkholderia vietnamiensis (strain G4 / LMG 22486) TaxID=269482 RepID=A4JVD9_BURVG|nr:hypothetical protein Bcep1808_7365 [Burkholderia vietnamiensis G4]MCB4349431.1 hypothetical protein [Burkholderia vietnamiensis]